MDLKTKKIKYVLCVSVCMCVCVCMISLFITVKNEKLTPSGKNIMAFYVENSDGEYVEREEKVFPTTGYVLNLEKSYCKNGGTLS